MVKTVIVLGMHRSGTSVTAGVLKRLGVDVGRKLLPGPGYNPTGFFENLEFVNLNANILRSLGGNWRKPPPQEAILKRARENASKIEEVVKRNIRELWGFKDPRTALTIEALHPYLPNVHVVRTRRSPKAIAQSLKSRDGMDEALSLELCATYNAHIDEYLKRYGVPNITVDYNQLIENPRAVIDRIINFLGIHPSREQVEEAVRLVVPEYRHWM